MLTSKNIKYGQLLDWQKEEGVISTSVKVHFFNKNGVLIGREYKFVPYNELQQHNGKCIWQKRYLHLKLGIIYQFIYEIKCRIITVLIRATQPI
jgi:hypothetical protein